MTRSPAVPYVVPFGVFLAFMGVGLMRPMPPWFQAASLVVMAAVLLWIARPALDFHVVQGAGSWAVGILIFALWVAPDLLFPSYRHSFLFQNSLVGIARSTMPETSRHDIPVLVLRSMRAVLVVPIIEELFWRGWLMRSLISKDFERVPLGKYSAESFWTVAVLFASEHGPYWDVGLAAGMVFNLWMIRTRSLGDLILTHAVANACLSAYVMAAGKWEYWL